MGSPNSVSTDDVAPFEVSPPITRTVPKYAVVFVVVVVVVVVAVDLTPLRYSFSLQRAQSWESWGSR